MHVAKLAFAVLLVSAPVAFAQSPSQGSGPFNGNWQFSLSVMGNDATDTCNLASDGATIKGSCATLGNLTGTINKSDVVFKTDGGQSPLVFTGKLQDGAVKGTVDVTSYSVQGDFLAKPMK